MTTSTETPRPSSPAAERARPTFDDLPLSPEVREALTEMAYEHPTAVQAAVFGPAAAGQDLVVQARTGTGKTAAFGLPLVDRLVRRANSAVQALVLCPTRELALQVSRELEKLSKHKGVQVVAVYGGAPMPRQIHAIAAGAQIVVGTPGRVLDHMRRGTLKTEGVRALVLDEADEMLSMGFERELTAILERLPEERQTLLFSATIPPDIERMARTRLHDPEFVLLSSDQVGALEIAHYVYWTTEDKPSALLRVLEIEDPESAIIFCNTREQTENVARYLSRHGFEADWLNGDLPQSDREKVMGRTREGKLRFLVATDVAARGIDISHLSHVINFDFPLDAELYVHRTGRTGRMGRMGMAISLVTPQEVGALYILRLTYKIRPIERRLPSAREERTRMEADIVRSLAETFASRGDQAEHLALARRLLSHEEAEAIVAGMLRAHLTTHPEMAELASSRRRARLPQPRPEEPAPRERTAPARRPEPVELVKADDETLAQEAVAQEVAPQQAALQEAAPQEAAPQEAAPQEAAPQQAAPQEAAPAPAARPRARRETARRRATTRRSEIVEEAPSAPSSRGSTPSARSSMEGTPSSRERRSEPESEGTAPVDPSTAVELHLDAGRRQGIRVRSIKSMLADGGVDPEHVHRVRVRDHYCFVEIDRALLDAALEALDGATVGEHKLKASVSERSGR